MIWSAGLCALGARRSASRGMLVAFLALAVLAAGAEWAPPPAVFAESLRAGVERGLARQGMWTVWLFAFVPIFLLKNALVVSGWRRGEASWLGSSPISAAAAASSLWSGFALASLAWVAATALWIESAAGVATQGLGYVRAVVVPDVALLSNGAPVRWESADVELRSGREVRAHLALAGGGASAEVRFRARRGDGAWIETGRRVAGRASLHLPLPGGSGPVVFELERREGSGVVVLLPRGLDLLEPVGTENRASLAIGTRVWLALIAAGALALGLGAWMAPATAAVLVLSLALLDWLGSAPSAWWPWAGLPTALGLVGEGLAPPFPPAAPFGGCLVALALGWGLVRAHSRIWRRA